MSWQSPRWNVYDGDLTAQTFVKATIKALFQKASAKLGSLGEEKGDNTEEKKAAFKSAEETVKFAFNCEKIRMIKAMLDLAKDEVKVSQHVLDSNPWLLNVKNRTVDLRTGLLLPHARENYLTKIGNVDYIPKAPCHLWEGFLYTIFQGNEELLDWLQKAIGYTLTGLTNEQCFFLCHGTGMNSKSVYLRIMAEITGDYGQSASFATFTHAEHNQAIRNDLAALRAARFVSAIESSAGQLLSDSTVKAASGGDEITCRLLYGEVFSYKPQYKIWLATNHKPKISDTTHGMWRRVCLIPFNVVIPDNEQDKDLGDKLKEELSGILAWAVRDCVRWAQEGLKPFPEMVLAATKDYREENDVVGEFIQEGCVINPNLSFPSSSLYAAFCKWSEGQGEKKPMSIMVFGAALTETGYKVERLGLLGGEEGP